MICYNKDTSCYDITSEFLNNFHHRTSQKNDVTLFHLLIKEPNSHSCNLQKRKWEGRKERKEGIYKSLGKDTSSWHYGGPIFCYYLFYRCLGRKWFEQYITLHLFCMLFYTEFLFLVVMTTMFSEYNKYIPSVSHPFGGVRVHHIVSTLTSVLSPCLFTFTKTVQLSFNSPSKIKKAREVKDKGFPSVQFHRWVLHRP